MHRADYVHPRPGSKVWQFCLPAPPDLRAHFGSQWAERKSLGTRDLREANARAKLWAAEWQTRFDELRGKPASTPKRAAAPSPKLAAVRLTPELIQEAAKLMHARMLEADEEARLAVLTAAEMESQALALEVEAGLLRRAYATGETGPVDNILPAWLVALGLDVSPSDPLRPRLARELVTARLRAIQARQARHRGELADTPFLPPLETLEAVLDRDAQELPPKDKPGHLLTLRDVFELWKLKPAKNGGKLAASTVARGLEVVEAFEEACGNPRLVAITRHHAHQLRDYYLGKGLTARSAKDRVDWVGTLIRFEVEGQGRLSVNPWPKVKVEGSSEPTLNRRDARKGELASLFSLPLFQQYDLPSAMNAGRDAAYWVPVLGVYTGARITELAQLLTADVYDDAGLWVIDFRVTHEWQSLKNKPSWRRIPVHPELVRLGFLDYCKAMRTAGHERLFPWVKVSEVNNAGGGLSSWFSKLKTEAGWGSQHSFHSFRHSVETILKRAKEPKSHIDRYTGHSGKDVADRTYTHLEAVDLIETAAKVRPEGLELPCIFPPANWSPPPQVPGVLMAKPRRAAAG